MAAILEGLKKNEVIPDVIDEFQPTQELAIRYSDSKVDVALGNVLTPTQVQNQPLVCYGAEEGAFYTLLMTDPDAPSRATPTYREWHHWLVGNIPGNKLSEGEILSQYVGSGPPQGTGLHRYCFILFKQPGKIEFTEPRLTNRSADNRGCFKTRPFMAKYGLQPIAANLYQAEWDDYVPKLYEQLSGN